MLKGKNAVVTGSTSGIGRAVASALAAQGANVMINGFGEPDAIDAMCRSMAAENGVSVRHHGADMSKPGEIAEMMATAEEAFGGVDILVNNAGIQRVHPIEAFPPEEWDAVIAINLSSAFHTMRLAVPGMRRRGWGRIINTASVHGLVASVDKAAYVAAKHGLVGMTKVVALETAETGITVNAFCPGWVRTELIEKQIAARAAAEGGSVEDGAKRLLAEKQPSKAFVMPDHIGQLVVFLCSDAAAQITGASIPIDGGWTAQ